MNRGTWWAAPVALAALLAMLWATRGGHLPPWAAIAGAASGVLGAFVAVVSIGQDRRAQAPQGPPRAASVEEFLAAVDRLYGTNGANSGGASPQVSASWNGEPYTRHGQAHDHPLGEGAAGRADCPGCIATLAVLITLAEAQAAASVAPEASGVILCGELFGSHRCDRQGAHDPHHCQCGTIWGRTGAGVQYLGKSLPPFRG